MLYEITCTTADITCTTADTTKNEPFHYSPILIIRVYQLKMFDQDLFGPPVNSTEDIASLPRTDDEPLHIKQLSRRQSSFLRSRCRDSLNRLNSNSSIFSGLDDSNDNSSNSSLKRLEKDGKYSVSA